MILSENTSSFLRQFYKPFCMVTGILILAIAIRHFHVLDLLLSDKNLLRRGFQGQVIFLAVATLMCTIGFPRQIVCFTAGVIYGFWLGLFLASIATLCGALVTFYWALWLGHGLARKYLAHDKLKRINHFIRKNPFVSILVCRLMPIGSSVLLNTVAGMVGIHILPFIAATFLGSLPQTIVFVLLGGGVRIGHTGQIVLSIVLFLLSVLIGVVLMKRQLIAKK